MTVIAFDGETLAADRRHTTSGDILLEPREKLRKSSLGAVAACGLVSSRDADIALLEAVASGVRDNLEYDGSAMVMLTSGQCFIVQGKSALWIQKPAALGSGYEVALGAMAAGKTAEEAVHIACQLVVSCGDGVDVYSPAYAA